MFYLPQDVMDVNESLLEEMENNVTGAVELLLKCGTDVNAKGYGGSTLLHMAAEKGYQEIIGFLLSKGADVNVKDVLGSTPLHMAFRKSNQETIRIILSKGVDVNAKGCNTLTPMQLHIAVVIGYQEIIEIIFSKGADVNAKDDKEVTPLHLAGFKCYQEFIIILLSEGADVNAKDDEEFTPLDLAVLKGYQEIIKILLPKGADVNAKSIYGSIPLELAVHEGNQDFLLECQEEIENMKIEKINKTNISFYDILTKTISFLAIYMRNENIVAVLKSDIYATKFPKYFGMIKCNFRMGMERKELLEQANLILHFIVSNFECSDTISSYLSNQDIIILIDAFKPLSISSPNIVISRLL